MEAYKEEFIEFMLDCEVLKFGDFVTKSGRNTPFFINTGFYRTGAQLKKLGEYYARTIHDTFGDDLHILNWSLLEVVRGIEGSKYFWGWSARMNWE